MLLIDVDHFKAYKDHHGHPAGDQCLKPVAKVWQTALRVPDAALYQAQRVGRDRHGMGVDGGGRCRGPG